MPPPCIWVFVNDENIPQRMRINNRGRNERRAEFILDPGVAGNGYTATWNDPTNNNYYVSVFRAANGHWSVEYNLSGTTRYKNPTIGKSLFIRPMHDDW